MKLRVLVVAVAAALAVVPPLVAAPTPAGADHSWGNYHWGHTGGSLTLQVLDNMTQSNPAWDAHLGGAVKDWDGSSVLTLTLAANWSNDGRKRCAAISGKIRACNERYGFNGWLGIAQIWISGGHIVQAVTKMNDSYFNTGTYNTPEWRRFVVCQEIGHTFGLDHQDEDFGPSNLGTCMDYTNRPQGGADSNGVDYGPSNVSPSTDTGASDPPHGDFQQLLTIYNAHTDSQNTFSPATASAAPGRSGTAADEGPNDPPNFGRPAGPKDSHGRDILFVIDLPDNQKLFTHVYWVEPGKPGAPQPANPR